jgi:hypothetical protein
MNQIPTVSKKEAIAGGYVSLTTPYNQNPASQELQWYENVKRDMKGCNCVIVPFANGNEIWRHNTELNLDHNGIRRGAKDSQIKTK